MVELLRRWAVQWLAAGDPSVCDEILDPGYRVRIGGHLLDGRDAYVQATLTQLRRFPGLGITVHELVRSGDRAAVRFTEHGAANRPPGRRAAWVGVALFRRDGDRLVECFAEEDYLSRRRQLHADRCDPIEPPAAAPWDTDDVAPDPGAEEIVRAWLACGDLAPATLDDGWDQRPAPALLAEPEIELGTLFSSGPKVAFHALQTGRYAGGLDGAAAEPERRGAHHLAGIVTVAGGVVVDGRIVRDRLGLARALQDA